MPALTSFDYAVVRIVPRVEREEFVNAGVVLLCLERGFLGARVALPGPELRALAPEADEAAVGDRLALIERVAAGDPSGGPIAELGLAERFHWLVAPSSTVIQPSPVHSGLCTDPAATLERLFGRLVGK